MRTSKKQQEKMDLVLDMYPAKSIETIAKELDIHFGTVSRWLKANGVEIVKSQHRRTDEQNKQINQKISSALKANNTNRQNARQAALGRVHFKQDEWTDEVYETLKNKESLQRYIEKHSTALQVANSLGCSYSTVERYLKEHDLWSSIKHRNTSTPEIALRNVVESWGVSLVANTKRQLFPKEIDMYSADHGVGVEFCGDYWHSELYKERGYHADKSAYAFERGIFLYHVFEYEWNDERRRTAILGQLRGLFGLTSRRLFARKCEVREIDAKVKNSFLDTYHVQGQDKASVKLGLFFEDELVSVMTFAKPRFSKKYQWELSRFAVKSDTRVIGGPSKLFKRFVTDHQPDSIVSYSDIAKTRGGMYQVLGFEWSHDSEPNYVWTDLKGNVLTRYQTQMKNERQVMHNARWVRVYDAGNRVHVWNKP